ncbi:hypothetical protein AnaeK_3936 [Anaeromyxobacter sp. K]|uniref:hypothetical protein n=1 Tax=Anaeromyxobacter sp. (strain K) TaxID=447217 RepID=UPI00015F885F|nr:hypothetical protein [Anaeromyxobacter sp. K]ACG75143.1 hypothetical protein AnaeK_3936 [Anaeromyxobacter sp. K]
MIRHFNYTKRRRIPQDRVEIELKPGKDAPSFDARINLSELELPSTAKVFVEAHYKSSYQRFDFGTVGGLVEPVRRALDEVDRGNTVLFRVKVVDTDDLLGRIVAEIDDITAEDGGGGPGRYCILPVNFVDLGEEMWRLALGGDRPVLEVNKFPGAEAFVRSDAVFAALVYPEAVRQVLWNIVLDDDWEGVDGLSGWREMWISFARTLTADEPPGKVDDEEREEWIRDVVRAFCERLKLKTRMLETRQQEHA